MLFSCYLTRRSRDTGIFHDFLFIGNLRRKMYSQRRKNKAQ